MVKDEYMEVLLVEDQPEDAELTIRELRKHNLVNNIKLLEDGQEALDYLLGEGEFEGKSPELPKLVLLDLKLPKVSGLEVLERMKSESPLKNIPVVMITSSSEHVDIQKAYELGVNSYIVKPVDFPKFAEAVRQIGLYWLVFNKSLDN